MRPPRRTTWLVAAVAVIVVIVVVAVAAYLAGRSSVSAAPASAGSAAAAPSTSAAPTASTTDSTLGAAPTGCLGGPSRTDAMVLAAQKQAPHTAYGAVEVAAAFFRWGDRFPYPTAADAREVSAALVAPNASASLKDIAASYAKAGDITHGEVPRGTPFYVSTAEGLWLASGSADRVLVSVNANYVIDGELSPTKTAAVAAVLVWTTAGWRLFSEQSPDVARLTSGGTQFTGGC